VAISQHLRQQRITNQWRRPELGGQRPVDARGHALTGNQGCISFALSGFIRRASTAWIRCQVRTPIELQSPRS